MAARQWLEEGLTEAMNSPPDELLTRLWRGIGGEPGVTDRVTVSGPEQFLPSVFDVTGLAAASVAVATLAAAQLHSARTGEPMRAVRVDRRQASAAFLGEVLFTPQGWQRPPAWDPVAGDYLAADGWIRLHTNYSYHRDAVRQVLGPVADRTAAAAAVSRWSAPKLQEAVVAAGGCAAAMNDRPAWLASAAGASSAREPVARIDSGPGAPPDDLTGPPHAGLPFSGIRVLDLTRVIAGPVCTKFLAFYGAEVLRIDPRGFDEVAALLPETSAGKRCARLDLRDVTDRAVFDGLLSQAHVLVSGLRPGALDRLGYDRERIRALNPGLITAALDAYGWSGPWAQRRGFDSLVQMSSGIAAAGAAATGQDRPTPLPAQALDHATGYLLAGAVAQALARLITTARGADIRCSLVATANVLVDHPTPDGLGSPTPAWSDIDTEATETEWGPARRVPVPGHIDGLAGHLSVPSGSLGRHAPTWGKA